MLTIADVRRALDKAPELRYVDRSWCVYANYLLMEGESGVYVCAPELLAVKSLLGTGPAYTANEAYDVGPEDELRENLYEYFLSKYRGSANEELNGFLVEFLRRYDDTADEEGRGRLYEWIRKEHEGLDEAVVDWLYDNSAGAFDELDEAAAEWLSCLYRQAVKAFRIGGQERLFRRLRKHYKGVADERTLEKLFVDMREDFERGASFVDVLSRVVSVDEFGLAMPGSFTQKLLFNIKQDQLRKLKGELDELPNFAKSRPRSFHPLSSPNLFIEFANLGARQINEEDVMEWVHRYGILGLTLEGHVGDVRSARLGGPQETVAAFAQEAEEANWIKRVYEAALLIDSVDDEVVKGAMRELRELFGWPVYHSPSPQECQEKALDAVRLGVQSHLDHHCLVRWQRAGNGLVEFLEFKNVIGAMYLQFAWVLRERAAVRRCKHCGKPVEGVPDAEETGGRKTYRNKRFCNRECKSVFSNGRKRKEESLRFSVPSATREEVETLATARGMDVDAFFQEMLQVYREHNQTR